MSVSAGDARRHLTALIEQVNADQAAVEIISRKGSAYLVPTDEYRSLQETVYLLRSPRNADRLRGSLAEVEVGTTQ